MNIVTVVRVTLVSTSIYLQTMPDTERSRVVWLAESPAQETVGQARLAGPLPSQHHNLPPEHAVQPLLPPFLPFLPEQQLNQVLTPLPTHPPGTGEELPGGECWHSLVCLPGSPGLG